jgi:hypothetical protein
VVFRYPLAGTATQSPASEKRSSVFPEKKLIRIMIAIEKEKRDPIEKTYQGSVLVSLTIPPPEFLYK